MAEYFRSLVIAEVAKHPLSGLKPAEIIERLREDASFRDKVSGNVQYPYSLLGRMVDKDQIAKRDGRFFPAPKEDTEQTTPVASTM